MEQGAQPGVTTERGGMVRGVAGEEFQEEGDMYM